MNFIFYHLADLDGHCSGAQVALYLESVGEPYIMVPFNYGYTVNKDKILEYEGRNLYLVDMSFSPEDMLWATKYSTKFIWIDHHKSAIENSQLHNYDSIAGLRRTDKAACALVYEYLELKYNYYPIELLSNWDIWNHKDRRTIYFQYAMREYDTDPTTQERIQFWHKIISHKYCNDIPKYIEIGEHIYNYEMKRYKMLASNSYEFKFEDSYNVLAINSLEHTSKLFDSIPNVDEYDFVLVYNYKPTTKNYRVSFYTSKPGIDVSKIATRYGGGGHVGAAGCEIPDISLLIPR